MSGILDGKTALITAAGQGIGRAAALSFAKAGAAVWATDINQVALDALKAEQLGIEIRILDVTDTDAVNALALEIGTLDVLFNCAGYVHQGSIFDCSKKD